MMSPVAKSFFHGRVGHKQQNESEAYVKSLIEEPDL